MKTFSDLLGKTLTSAKLGGNDDEIVFVLDDGSACRLYHRQNCCESVFVESIVGELDDLVGSPITMADESSGEIKLADNQYGSGTWTFYKLATARGFVDIRWKGESNGYYSESVDFEYFPPLALEPACG